MDGRCNTLPLRFLTTRGWATPFLSPLRIKAVGADTSFHNHIIFGKGHWCRHQMALSEIQGTSAYVNIVLDCRQDYGWSISNTSLVPVKSIAEI
jgi:hypothetical protein